MSDDFQWDEKAIGKLQACWADGVPTTEIGRLLGTTKNSVVGKAKRLHLTPRANCILPSTPESRARQVLRAARRNLPEKRTVPKPDVKPAALPLIAIPAAPLRQCCFPLWGHREKPSHKFCGAPSHGSWCAAHRAVVFTPSGLHSNFNQSHGAQAVDQQERGL